MLETPTKTIPVADSSGNIVQVTLEEIAKHRALVLAEQDSKGIKPDFFRRKQFDRTYKEAYESGLLYEIKLVEWARDHGDEILNKC